MRVVRRAEYEHKKKRLQFKRNNQRQWQGNGKRKAVLLIGAGRAGMLAAKEMEARGDLDLKIKGFVDDDRAKLGRLVVQSHGFWAILRIYRELVRSLGNDHVVITIAHASRHQIHRIVKICERFQSR